MHHSLISMQIRKIYIQNFLCKSNPPPQKKITKQNKKPKTELGPTQIRNLIFKA